MAGVLAGKSVIWDEVPGVGPWNFHPLRRRAPRGSSSRSPAALSAEGKAILDAVSPQSLDPLLPPIPLSASDAVWLSSSPAANNGTNTCLQTLAWAAIKPAPSGVSALDEVPESATCQHVNAWNISEDDVELNLHIAVPNQTRTSVSPCWRATCATVDLYVA